MKIVVQLEHDQLTPSGLMVHDHHPADPGALSRFARLTGEGLFTDEEIGTTCCFATQDKVWVTGPAGEKWEVYTVLADSDTFGSSPQLLEDTDENEGGVCCGGTAAGGAGQTTGTASC